MGEVVTRESLLKKYPSHQGMKYDPKPDCKYCKGTGERKVNLSDGSLYETVCICTYVDHSVAEEMQAALSKVAKEVLKEFRNE